MMPLERLKIEEAYYQVRNRELNPNLYGQVDLRRKRMDIADDLDGEEAVYALVHEMLHAIWWQRGVPVRPREERVVTELAWGLSRLFHDNPGLLGHLEQLLKESR